MVDAPEQAATLGFPPRAAESLDEFGLATFQPRQRQQIGDRVPGAVLEHSLAPLSVKQLAAGDLESGSTRVCLEERRQHVLRTRRGRREKPLRLLRFERLRGERLIDEHRAAGSQHALALRQSAVELDVVEHVAAPDVVKRLVVERKRLELRLCNSDTVAESFVRNPLLCTLDVKWNGIDGYDVTAESPHELDRVRSVARSSIEDDVLGSDA